jgi:pyridoxamine 5'-phosphate oxidase
MTLEELRRTLNEKGFAEADADPNPFDQFREWYVVVLAHNVDRADAMTLATADTDGKPSARMVLLKGFDERGFLFFTSYDGRKARELEANPSAALVFYWKEVDRQVRIEGRVERVSAAESDAYFQTRPWLSRVSAAISPQSEVIPGRRFLEERAAEMIHRCPNQDMPRPVNWGGYRVVPTAIEFWQGRENRLHDRLLYSRTADNGWRIERLAP